MRTILALAALLLVPPLLAVDVVALGPEHSLHRPGITAGAAHVGQPIPNEDGYLLPFNRLKHNSYAYEPLQIMQLDMAGHPEAQWALDTGGDHFAGVIGVRTRSGTYVISCSDSHDEMLVFLGANGRDVLGRVSFPQRRPFTAFDCGVDRCVGATEADGDVQLFAFSFDGRQLAGPLAFGRGHAVAILANGSVFRLGWSDKEGIHATTLDAALTRFGTENLAPPSSEIAAAWNDRPTYFYTNGNDVYALLPGFPAKHVAHFDDIAYIGTIHAAWNGSEFLVMVNVVIDGGSVYE